MKVSHFSHNVKAENRKVKVHRVQHCNQRNTQAGKHPEKGRVDLKGAADVTANVCIAFSVRCRPLMLLTAFESLLLFVISFSLNGELDTGRSTACVALWFQKSLLTVFPFEETLSPGN